MGYGESRHAPPPDERPAFIHAAIELSKERVRSGDTFTVTLILENLSGRAVDYDDRTYFESLMRGGILVGGFDPRTRYDLGAMKATLEPHEVRRFPPVELDTRSCRAPRGSVRPLLPPGTYEAVAAVSLAEPYRWVVPTAAITIVE